MATFDENGVYDPYEDDWEAEIDAAERATAHPIESACVVYYGTMAFGEVLIHVET